MRPAGSQWGTWGDLYQYLQYYVTVSIGGAKGFLATGSMHMHMHLTLPNW